MRTAVVALLSFAVTGCNSALGIDELSYDGPSTGLAGAGATGGSSGSGGQGAFAGGGAAGGGASGGAESCPAGTQCRPSYEQGVYFRWLGMGSCQADETATSFAECDGCTCETPSGGTCLATVELFADSACTTAQVVRTSTSTSGTCFDLSVDASPSDVRAELTRVVTPGTCSPSSSDIEPTVLGACRAEPKAECDFGVCLAGNLPCVAIDQQDSCRAPYVLDRLIYPAATSGCNCSCSAAATCPSLNAWAYPGKGCDGSGQQLTIGASCASCQMSAVESLWILPGTALTECAAVGNAPGALKVCCLPP